MTCSEIVFALAIILWLVIASIIRMARAVRNVQCEVFVQRLYFRGVVRRGRNVLRTFRQRAEKNNFNLLHYTIHYNYNIMYFARILGIRTLASDIFNQGGRGENTGTLIRDNNYLHRSVFNRVQGTRIQKQWAKMLQIRQPCFYAP